MTSKISFLNIRKEYMRHHIAELLLVVFAVFCHMLWFVIYLQNTLKNFGDSTIYKREDILFQFMKGIRSTQSFVILAGMLGAVLAMMAFRYLHSRQKVDFYHSLPIKRKDMFRIIVTSHFLMFLLSLLVGFLLEALICGAAGYLTAAVFKMMATSFVIYLLSFCICFMTEALAMILTGHLAVGFLGGCVFALYAPFLVYSVSTMYAQNFFDTYAAKTDATLLYPFSPLTLSVGLGDFDGDHYGISTFYVVVTLVWIVALLLLCRYLFQIRRSEMAGKAMAFPKMNTVLRFLLVVPMSLFSGLALYNMTLADSKVWLTAGIALGSVLFHGLVEAVYQLDVRGLWSHKKQMVLTMVLSFAVAGAFWLDIFGYDSWLPKKDKLESVIIEDSSFMRDSEYWGESRKGLKGEDLENAYALLSAIIEDKAYQESGSGVHSLTVIYQLKDGKTKERTYTIPADKYIRELDTLYGSEEFKKDNLSLYTAPYSRVSEVSFSMFTGEMYYGEIDRDDQQEFLEIYTKEMSSLGYSDILYTLPTGSVDIFHYGEGSTDPVDGSTSYYGTTTMGNTCYIYPSFTETVKWLEEKGYMDKIEEGSHYTIQKLDVTCYPDGGQAENFSVTDKEVIDAVKDKLIPSELIPAGSLSDIQPDVTIDVEYTYSGSGRDVSYITMQTDRETVQKLLEAAGKK